LQGQVDLSSQFGNGIEVGGIQFVVLNTCLFNVFENVCQQQHVSLKVQIVIFAHGANLVFCPNSLSILVVLIGNVSLGQFVVKVSFGRKSRLCKSGEAIHLGTGRHPFSH